MHLFNRGFENISDMLVPLVWFEESAQVNEETADKFKSKYRDPIRRVNTLLFSLLVSSILLFAINLHLLVSNKFGKNSYNWKPTNGNEGRNGEKSDNKSELIDEGKNRRESVVGLIGVTEKPETLVSQILDKTSGLDREDETGSSRGALSEQLKNTKRSNQGFNDKINERINENR